MKTHSRIAGVISFIMFALLLYCGSYYWIVFRRSHTVTLPTPASKGTPATKPLKAINWLALSDNEFTFYRPICQIENYFDLRYVFPVAEPHILKIFTELPKKPAGKVLSKQYVSLIMMICAMENSKLAGEWEDDPENWKRAFGVDVPKGIRVIHSKYWRSNHFTVEFIYYFELEVTAKEKQNLIGQLTLQKTPPDQINEPMRNPGSEPAWFLPGTKGEYDEYYAPNQPGPVWINKNTGHVFLHEEQI